MKEWHLREIEQRAAGERLGPWARLLILSLVAEIRERQIRESEFAVRIPPSVREKLVEALRKFDADTAPALRKHRTPEWLEALANSIKNNQTPATLAAAK